jgi:hypothetical protein
MDVIINFLQADVSFAGVGAYYSQGPMKTFEGMEPCLPLAVVVEALDKMQSGQASTAQKEASRQLLKPDTCLTNCLVAAQATCAASPAPGFGPRSELDVASCILRERNACYLKCPTPGAVPPQ